jgi:ribosomal protein L11 methyltransferase
MTVYKAEIFASPAEAEQLVSLFGEMLDPPPAISTHEREGGWLVELYFDQGPPDRAVLDAVAEIFTNPGLIRDLRFEALPDENWVEKTQQGLHPIEAGRFFVHGSHDRVRGRGKRYAIEVEAGQAFGTAHHGTTRGCLLMIDRLAKVGWFQSVLDLGTGSGVLAIAAAKSLSDNVLAADIDPIAVQIADENFALNGVSNHARALCASRPDHSDIADRAPFDLIVANILAGPLITLAPSIRRIIADGGQLVLSGLLDHQAQSVRAHYLAQGFTMRTHLSLDGWTTLHLQF